MQKLLARIGVYLYWLSWPAFYIYFLHSERTRVIIAYGEEIVVVKGWLSDGKWSLPGGGIKRGENVRAAALREVREETGLALRIRQLQPLHVAEFREHGLRFYFFCFLIELERKSPLQRQRREIAEIAWLNRHNLNQKNAGQDVLIALEAWRRASAGPE